MKQSVWQLTRGLTSAEYDAALDGKFITYTIDARGDHYDLDAFDDFNDAALAIGDENYAAHVVSDCGIVAIGIRF
jgi:hypothetical protein